jgi:hypothetical protein
MIKQKQKSLYIFLLLVLLTQACMQVKSDATALPTAQNTASPTQAKISPTRTAQATPTAIQVTPSKTKTPASKVKISAVKGNLFIRRGPDMAYNPIGVLYKDTTAVVVARDVLAKWAQIIIPNSAEKGWVSTLTEYSKVTGSLDSLPQFTITDWPLPAYLRNCTHHQMFIEPGKIFLDSSYTIENEVWLYPGHYTIYDISLPDEPAFLEVDVREGVTVEINEDGEGKHRKCPE